MSREGIIGLSLRRNSVGVLSVLAFAVSPTVVRGQLAVTVTDTPRSFYRSTTHGCDNRDIPDAPARAFRDERGEIQFFASFEINRAMAGSVISGLKHDCRIRFRGGHNDDPAAFDDRSWLASFYTFDGKAIYALVHNEFQGRHRKSLCPSGNHVRCWYDSISFATSQDGGRSFRAKRGALVAAPYHRYIPDAPRRLGPASPSNIVAHEGSYYFLYVNDVIGAGGHICVARTRDITDPASWRAWDGTDFSIPIGIDPYIASPPRPPCTHLRGLVSGSMGSLVRHEPSGTFILTQTSAEVPSRAAGFYYATSRDLITWTKPRVFLELPTYRIECGVAAIYDYPSLIDPNSRSRNFETLSGNSAALFFVRQNVVNCHGSLDRELMTATIRIAD